MSAIPPAWLASSINAQDAQRAGERRTREAVTASPASAPVFADRLTELIETSDRDSEVYSDAEGQGGGRGKSHTDENEPSPSDVLVDASSDASALDADGDRPHIDLQA